MYSITSTLQERGAQGIWQPPGIVTKVLLTTLLAGSLIILSSCGNNQGSSGTSRNTPSSTGSQKSKIALSSLHMLDETNGWATTQSSVLRTTDGGLHWQDVTPPKQSLLAGSGAAFLTTSNVWLAIPQASSSNTLVFRTVDGGQTWQQARVQTGRAAYVQITFVDAQHGWLMSHMGGGPQVEIISIFRTIDGGQTWAQVTNVLPASTDGPPPGKLPYGGTKSGLSFLNTSIGWVSGSVLVNNLAWFFVTHDGGSTWRQQTLPSLPNGISAQLSLLPPKFFTSTDGILPVNFTGDKNSGFGLYVTHDSGNTWESVPVTQPASWVSIVDLADRNHR